MIQYLYSWSAIGFISLEALWGKKQSLQYAVHNMLFTMHVQITKIGFLMFCLLSHRFTSAIYFSI